MLSPASRIESASSFGVFWRTAPSTRPIMRSRKVAPGSALILIRSASLTTCVPPVTDERMSVPGSLSTGADSPVMAASLTYATPSITSPSLGIVSPSRTTTISPLPSADDGTISSRPSSSRRAGVARFVARNVSACALPRASAMASAKLANTTVNHSQSVI